MLDICIKRIIFIHFNAGMSNQLSKLGEILYRAEVGGLQKAVCAESCSDFLSFVPKLRCSLKKRSSPRVSSYLLISAPNVFQQSRGTLLRNLHYSQKTGNCRWAVPEP